MRLLVFALENHPEDLETLQAYGDMAEDLADLVDDFINDDDTEEEDRCQPARGPERLAVAAWLALLASLENRCAAVGLPLKVGWLAGWLFLT